MRLKILTTSLLGLLLGAALLPAYAADPQTDRVLRKLDAAAKNFHTATAEFQFDSVETDPIPDKDIQRGRIYYQRTGAGFQMAAHITEHNGKTDAKTYTYANGIFKLFEQKLNQVTVLTKFNKFESYVMLGFGASGEDLEKKWQVRSLGTETLDGIHCEKLELIARDPDVRKHLGKVTIWIDAERAVSLKQVFEEGPTTYRVSVYYNLKTNTPLPADAFVLKTDSHTTTVTK